MPTIAEAVKIIMVERGETYVSRCEYGLLDEAYALADSPRKSMSHPLDVHKSVLQAISRSPLFKLEGRMRMDIGQGLGERLYPLFSLKTDEADK